MKPWQTINKTDVGEAEHVSEAYSSVRLAKREDRAYSDAEWAKVEKQQTAILNGEWIDCWKEYLQDQNLATAERALTVAKKLHQEQNRLGLQMYPQQSLKYRMDVLKAAIKSA